MNYNPSCRVFSTKKISNSNGRPVEGGQEGFIVAGKFVGKVSLYDVDFGGTIIKDLENNRDFTKSPGNSNDD
jgi:hypothetical protein